MKKFLLVSMAALVLASTFWFSAGTANAAGSVVVLYMPGVTQRQLKDATMFVNSGFEPVYCTLQDAETGKVVCHVPGKYAGEGAQIFLAGRVFTATVSPERTGGGKAELLTQEESLTCEGDEALGAAVLFSTTEGPGDEHYHFIEGSTISEVESNATTWLGGYHVAILEIMELSCGADED